MEMIKEKTNKKRSKGQKNSRNSVGGGREGGAGERLWKFSKVSGVKAGHGRSKQVHCGPALGVSIINATVHLKHCKGVVEKIREVWGDRDSYTSCPECKQSAGLCLPDVSEGPGLGQVCDALNLPCLKMGGAGTAAAPNTLFKCCTIKC